MSPINFPQIDYDHIIESNKLDDLKDKKLCDFVIIDKYTEKGQSIIETWKDHLTAKNHPWALERCGDIHILWKIDERFTSVQIKNLRLKAGMDERWFVG